MPVLCDTPWWALRQDPEIGRLPGLGQAIVRTLAELSDAGGLGTTARLILTLAERQDWWPEAQRRGEDMSGQVLSEAERPLVRLIDRVRRARLRTPLWYFEIGELICQLGTAPVPALAGVTEPHFDMHAHGGEARRKQLYDSTVTLSPFGHALLAGEADWSAHNPAHRWIGGTRLTNDAPWRWDPVAAQFIVPRSSEDSATMVS